MQPQPTKILLTKAPYFQYLMASGHGKVVASSSPAASLLVWS